MGISQIPPSAGVKPFVQTFTSTGTWTAPSTTTSITLFLVGGGGGGGGSAIGSNDHAVVGGGGGGGCVVKTTATVVPGTTYTVTIGAGGAGGTSTAAGSIGSDSTITGSGFTTITALGGGGAPSGNRSSGVYYSGTARGTSGGAYGFQGSVSGGGGGAGGNGISYNGASPSTDLSVFVAYTGSNFRYPSTPGNASIPSSGGMGAMSNRGGNYQYTQGGIGIDNYGAGGPAAGAQADTGQPQIIGSYAGIAARTASSCSAQNGVASFANTGNGGGGSLSWNTSDCGPQSASGGAGGSGFCYISYMA